MQLNKKLAPVEMDTKNSSNILTGGRRTVSNIKNTNPLVSVITVCYNAEKDIRNCLNSILEQPFRNIEHIVIDGNSSDKTIAILSEFKDKIEFWISEKDTGIYNAMNKAINYAHGEWIIFLGADDTLLNGFAEMTTFLKEKNTVYYGDYISDTKRYGGKFNSYRLAKANFCQQNVLYPSIVFSKYRFDEKYRISADHLLNMQCWADNDIKFQYYPVIITDFSSKGISSLQIDVALEADRDSMIKKYLGYLVFLRYQLKLFKNKLKGHS